MTPSRNLGLRVLQAGNDLVELGCVAHGGLKARFVLMPGSLHKQILALDIRRLVPGSSVLKGFGDGSEHKVKRSQTLLPIDDREEGRRATRATGLNDLQDYRPHEKRVGKPGLGGALIPKALDIRPEPSDLVIAALGTPDIMALELRRAERLSAVTSISCTETASPFRESRTWGNHTLLYWYYTPLGAGGKRGPALRRPLRGCGPRAGARARCGRRRRRAAPRPRARGRGRAPAGASPAPAPPPSPPPWPRPWP